VAKFHSRLIKRKYLTKRIYDYRHYELSLPSRLNKEIDSYCDKPFDVADFSVKDSDEKETITITLTRYKTVKKLSSKDFIEKMPATGSF